MNDKAAGVAAYLSPEQVQGKPVDQRSNTYSLAAVFYHLITGEPPFQGTPETVMELHVSSPPLAPSQRRPEAALSPEVDRVVLKALDKSSSRRHLTLRLFLSEVDALVAPEGAPATGAAAGKDAPHGFAKTMLFAGGQAEVANLVAKAIASRTGSPATGVPLSAPPPAAAPAPAPAARRITPSATPSARAPQMPATTEVNRPVAGGTMATNGKKNRGRFRRPDGAVDAASGDAVPAHGGVHVQCLPSVGAAAGRHDAAVRARRSGGDAPGRGRTRGDRRHSPAGRRRRSAWQGRRLRIGVPGDAVVQEGRRRAHDRRGPGQDGRPGRQAGRGRGTRGPRRRIRGRAGRGSLQGRRLGHDRGPEEVLAAHGWYGHGACRR